MKTVLTILLAISPAALLASTHRARIVKLENTADVYVPGENKTGGFKHVKYLGNVYHVVPATKGQKLDNGFILTTGPQSKAKVIFNNGDHFFVSENTQYKIDWKPEGAGLDRDPSVINLMRGAVRGLIQKDGPRSGMKVETSHAVMGVRGTDFFVSEKHGEMSVSVMRGEVEVKTDKKEARPTKVLTGQTLTNVNEVVTLTAITKEDLQQIAKGSVVQGGTETLPPQEAKELAVLETSAKDVTLGDIKEYQPQLYKEITEKQKLETLSSDSLAVSTVKILEEKAPSRAKKPSQRDLEDEADPYEKYDYKKKK